MSNPVLSPVDNSVEDVYIQDIPRIGMTCESENAAYCFYNQYGRNVGFSIRRDHAHRSKEDPTIIKQRRFVCNRHGRRKKDKRDINTKEPRAETRTDCLARMCISRVKDGQYECKDFFDDHNNELHTPATSHLMQSQCQISNIVVHGIDLADDSGIRPKATFDLMGMQVGGSENLGCTRVDLNNYLRTKRQHDLAFGEAGSLLAYFENQTRNNPSFTYSLQLDNGEQITNKFWADPRMLIDYAVFGDVVIFDTTFCTNKEYRPFGIFAGFNHHRGATIFGVALLYDETVPSFKWLFETFLETHGQKKPKTIFTDQDAAMSRAIAEVLPEKWHGLCTWHLMHNGIKHLGNLMKHGLSFLKDLNKCIFQYENEEEFENAWKILLDDYQLGNNSWQFERVVEDKRANELKAEFEARNTLPRTMGCNAPVLRQAGKVYTPYIFNEFRREHDMFLTCSVKYRTVNDIFHQYIVGMVDEEGEFVEGEHTVLYKIHEQVLECSCRKFETYGILCCHVLKVLDVLEIKCIPEKYILRRWTRAAKDILVEDSKGKEVMEDVQLSRTQSLRHLMPKYVKLVNQASNTDAGFEMANISVDILAKELATLTVACPTIEDSVQCSEAYMDLVLKKEEGRKGGGKRHKAFIETTGKQKKCNKTVRSQTSVSMETLEEPSQSLATSNVRGVSQYTENQLFTSLLLAVGSSQGSTTIPLVDLSPGQETAWRPFQGSLDNDEE
ncbi:protein FAR1-RELATED SEQUENCE 5-like [Telopea speciosissima]|uniref:protein FAR1-RELATED SEQUENCE 5-like n=1 Tax=Telopea speciosissima TaxID=54955 RepID=UPI001CC53BB6|nr:protein FAR1-RELATED SEQUENCE 5-like [Telopea speciosissima]